MLSRSFSDVNIKFGLSKWIRRAVLYILPHRDSARRQWLRAALPDPAGDAVFYQYDDLETVMRVFTFNEYVKNKLESMFLRWVVMSQRNGDIHTSQVIRDVLRGITSRLACVDVCTPLRHGKPLLTHHNRNNFMKHHEYYIYFITNPNRTVLYIGITNDIARRLVEHYANRGRKETFAGRYYCYCLVYIEMFQYVDNAIQRETELKDWRRELKNELIAGFNPRWKFLNAEWCGEWPPRTIWGDYYQSLRNPLPPEEPK